jgi:hypothetical protein
MISARNSLFFTRKSLLLFIQVLVELTQPLFVYETQVALGQVLSEYLGFPQSLSFHQCSIFIHLFLYDPRYVVLHIDVIKQGLACLKSH